MRVAKATSWRPRIRGGALLKASLLAGTFALAATAQAVADFSGTWILNVAKSSWDGITKPASVVLTIGHHEPRLDYSGAVLYTNEDNRDFSFHGAIDGKEYAMTRSFGEGSITLRRIDHSTIRSEFRTRDGRYSETAVTTLSQNGQRLSRRLRVQSPDGERAWIEIYDRQ